MNSAEEIAQFINDVISDGSQTIGVEDELVESGVIDSLAILQLVEFISQKFDVNIEPDYITPEHFSTPLTVAKLIKSISSSST